MFNKETDALVVTFKSYITGHTMRVVQFPVDYPYPDCLLDEEDFGVYCEAEDVLFSNVYTRRWLEEHYPHLQFVFQFAKEAR